MVNVSVHVLGLLLVYISESGISGPEFDESARLDIWSYRYIESVYSGNVSAIHVERAPPKGDGATIKGCRAANQAVTIGFFLISSRHWQNSSG